MIVIVIFVFFLVIIITICVIRRVDVKKYNYRVKNVEEMKIMETMVRNSSTRFLFFRGFIDYIIFYRDFGRNRKEVSFLLEEDSLFFYFFSNSFSVFIFKLSLVDF